LLLLLLSSLSL